MKEIIKKWLGINALEELLKLKESSLRGEIDMVNDRFEIREGEVFDTGRNLNTAVRYIMHHLGLGWQIEIREELPVCTVKEVTRNVIKPRKDIKTMIVRVKPSDHTNTK